MRVGTCYSGRWKGGQLVRTSASCVRDGSTMSSLPLFFLYRLLSLQHHILKLKYISRIQLVSSTAEGAKRSGWRHEEEFTRVAGGRSREAKCEIYGACCWLPTFIVCFCQIVL